MGRRSFPARHPALVAVGAGLAVLETLVVAVLDGRMNLALAPQVSAPPPFGMFHDLRWLLVYHQSWVTFGLEAAALFAIRTAIVAAMLRLAWPEGFTPPSWGEVLRRAALYVPVAAVVLMPWAGLLFGMAVAPVSWLFFGAVPVVLVLAVLLHPAAVTTSWWRHLPPLRGAGWMLLTFVVLTLTGVAITLVPAALVLPVAAACGLFNAWAWKGVVSAVVCRRCDAARAVRFPRSPVAIAAVLVVVVGGTAVGFELSTGSEEVREAARTRDPDDGPGPPVLIVTGFASDWGGGHVERLPERFRERRFSYRGIDGEGRPLPYGPEDTHRSLASLVATMARQVEALAADAGEPVSIVAESEGALVATAYLATASAPLVDELIMLSPLVRPGKVYFPPDGEQGWGVVSGLQLDGLAAAVRAMSPLPITTDAPLVRSILDAGALLRDLMACPLPGVRRMALVPLADAVVAVPPDVDGLDIAVIPAFHGGLLGEGDVTATVAAVLDGGSAPRLRLLELAERVIGAGTAAWQVPELAPGVNDVWDGGGGSCDAARARLRAILASSGAAA